jgi:hypothetical protein
MGAGISTPLAVAVNRRFTAKMQDDPALSPQENGRRWYVFNTTFENESMTARSLCDAVASGHSFCPRHRHQKHKEVARDGSEHWTSYRHSLNWMPTSAFGIDIDHGGMTLLQLEQDPFFHQYGCLGYTTTNHSDAHPRIRAVFAVSEPVQKLDNYRLLKRAVAARYGADPCDGNAMHAYGGNATPTFFCTDILDNRLPLAVARAEVAALLEQRRRQAEERQRQAEARAGRYRCDDPDDWPNEDDVAEMLKHLPRKFDGDYMKWLKVLMAVHSEFPGDAGIDLVEAWSPGSEGEVAIKFRSFRGSDYGPSIGWLITLARSYGYTPRPQRERARKFLFDSVVRAALS